MANTQGNGPVSPRNRLRAALGQGDGAPTVMERVRRRYIKTGRDDDLKDKFDALLTDLCERPAPDNPEEEEQELREAGMLLVLGVSGAGKTRSLARLFERHPVLQAARTGPDGLVLSMTAPSPCGVKELGRAILLATGYAVLRDRVTGPEIWSTVRARLQALGVLVLHIDEAQHATQIRDAVERQKLRNSLKALMVDGEHPVALILSGLPVVADFVLADRQLSRRASWYEFRSVGLPADTTMLTKALTSFAELAGMSVSEGEMLRILPRLVHAGDHRMGVIVEEMHDAIRSALADKAEKLEIRHFETAFAKRTGNARQWNPYSRSDYRAVDVWRMLQVKHLTPPPVTKSKKARDTMTRNVEEGYQQ
ncbi:ATP-binding protein [Methylobacterium sp.]|uniref:ATP-binding protein n=1 Tax=Methylobacterium sp. TaxID=409 RepID=UPI000C41C8E6|nr:ATP-binding protein [Methylobacterium sp.]MBP31881.1 hypothetical protein [Methylobacterium sp.]